MYTIGTWNPVLVSIMRISLQKVVAVLNNADNLRICKCLSHNSLIIHAFITSRLDYCNGLFFGLPLVQLAKLQRVQKSAARLIGNTNSLLSYNPHPEGTALAAN